MRAKAARAAALLFGLSLLLAACDESSVREFLGELFPPPTESAGAETASEDAGDGAAEDDASEDDGSEDDGSEDDGSEDDGSEESADEESGSGDADDDQRCINRNEHRGNLRSPPLPEEEPSNDGAGEEQSESDEGDEAADEPAEQEDAGNASEEEQKQERPARRERRREAAAQEEDSEPEDAGGQSSGLSNIEQQVFDLLNAERQRAGLSPLRLDSSLSQGARAWSRRMATEGFFEHDTSGNFAENIAYGYPSAAAVHDGWMNSEGHRNNRMNSRYTTYGVGVFEQGNTLYYTERFR